MPEADNATAFGKKLSLGFTDTFGREKDERVARQSLRDLMLFNNALESELKSMRAATGKSLDQKLFEKMNFVKDKYNYAMSGFKAFDDDMQKSALAALVDAIQDLMMYLNAKRSH